VPFTTFNSSPPYLRNFLRLITSSIALKEIMIEANKAAHHFSIRVMFRLLIMLRTKKKPIQIPKKQQKIINIDISLLI